MGPLATVIGSASGFWRFVFFEIFFERIRDDYFKVGAIHFHSGNVYRVSYETLGIFRVLR